MLIGTIVNQWEGVIKLTESKGDEPNFDLGLVRNDEGNALFLVLATKRGTFKVELSTTGSDWDIYAFYKGRKITLGYNGGTTDRGSLQVNEGDFFMICINCWSVGGDKTGNVRMYLDTTAEG